MKEFCRIIEIVLMIAISTITSACRTEDPRGQFLRGEKGERKNATFTLVPPGSNEFTIEKVEASCSCLVPSLLVNSRISEPLPFPISIVLQEGFQKYRIAIASKEGERIDLILNTWGRPEGGFSVSPVSRMDSLDGSDYIGAIRIVGDKEVMKSIGVIELFPEGFIATLDPVPSTRIESELEISSALLNVRFSKQTSSAAFAYVDIGNAHGEIKRARFITQ